MKSELFVAGISGPSANDDRISLLIYQEVRKILEELQKTFRTSSPLVTEDFNAVLHPNDSCSEHITKKPNLEMMEDFHQ
jgi:hypothetical protein